MNASPIAGHPRNRRPSPQSNRTGIIALVGAGPGWLWRGLALALGFCLCLGGAQAATLSVTVRNADGKPLDNAVVTANWRGSAAPPPTATPAIMAQEHRAFVPHVLVVPRGSLVAFPNRDTTRHEVYSFSPPKVFEIDLYAGQPKKPIPFDKPGVVVLGCNIHDTMRGYIIVTESPAWGKTDARGQITLSGLPLGNVTLKVWHPWLAAQADRPTRQVDTTRTTEVTMTLDVKPPIKAPEPLSNLQQRFNRLNP
ncbi:methylamine utilization protein [Mangrovitalea sediminis]|uniref:methylamine utilization protein n=1 Tax=Mangrovitalea sediminis TaxID=1982043 RepID=UPI000BE55814|nr:methylamine utilization protein [Mangrovitalea sediminis]